MKWHNLMILLATLVLVIGVTADSPSDELDEFSIPDDIDDGELDEDEEILRLLEEKRIVSWNIFQKCDEMFCNSHEIFSEKIWSVKTSMPVTWLQNTTLNMDWLKELSLLEWFVSFYSWINSVKNLIHKFPDDPCTKIHCGAGRVCQVQDDSAQCICIPDCPEEVDPRRKVCTNRNETWGSDCEVHRQRCLCDTKDERCTNAKNSHIHIEYYGECKELKVNINVHAVNDIPSHKRRGKCRNSNSPFMVVKECFEK